MIRDLGPKYEKEFFLITNPAWWQEPRKCCGRYWHCFEDSEGAYHEIEYSWDNSRESQGGVIPDYKYNPEEYKRSYSTPKSYYVFVDSRCKLRRWMKENFNG